MTQICRHLLASGSRCTQPAVRKSGAPANGSSPAREYTLYCRHHQVVKRSLAQVVPLPDPYGLNIQPLPFVFAEDRASLQLNVALVIAALNSRQITVQLANCFNRLLRTCEANLRRGPLCDPKSQPVQHIDRTPDGEEIAPPAEALEITDHSNELSSRPEPLRSNDAAEEPVLSLPKEPAFAQSPANESASSSNGSSPDEHGMSQQSSDSSVLSVSSAVNAECDESSNEANPTAPAPAATSGCTDPLYLENLHHRQEKYAARAQSALAAGLEPPAWEAFDPQRSRARCNAPILRHSAAH